MSTLFTKRLSTVFLQAIVILVGMGAFAFLLWEPRVEGVNAHATTLREIYFDDPFLAYVYIGSIPFFVALYQAFTVLGFFGENRGCTSESLRALRKITYCAAALVAFILGAEAYIVIFRSGSDDIAGGVAMGLFAMLISVATGTAAAVLEKVIRRKKL